MQTAYDQLQNRFRQIHNLQNAMAILNWDEAVVMPSGSGASRNNAMAELAGVIQTLGQTPEIGDWLAAAEADRALEPMARANLREMKRAFVQNTAIPTELNQRLVLAKMTCEQRWRDLRAKNDWVTFKPFLAEVLTLTREAYQHLAKSFGTSLYDTALAQFSNGLTTEVVNTLFDDLKTFLPPLIKHVTDDKRARPPSTPRGKFPMAAQKALGKELMERLGFSFSEGRLDESHHPFCGGTPRDVRITTRYNEGDFLPALMGVLHETGHALYEQHLPRAFGDQPVGGAAGMAVHESQSLFFEMQICRSPEFLTFAAPVINRHLGTYCENPESLTPENLVRLVTEVEAGFIRVDADEVTYPAHVILRFELERDLLNETLKLGDLPEAWNAKMEKYLGLSTRGRDNDGCMQDVHWPAGLFGYFPAYTFGAVIAAQLNRKLRHDVSGIGDDIARGEFGRVRGWLDQKIWSQGARLTTLDLVREAAGPLSTEAFKAHLNARYGG